jgi:hypothetical protein
MGAPTRIRFSDSPIGVSGRPTGETAEPEGTELSLKYIFKTGLN